MWPNLLLEVSRQVDLLAFYPWLSTSEYIGSCQCFNKLLSGTWSCFFLHMKESWISVKSKPWWGIFWYQSREQNQRPNNVPHLPWIPGDFFSLHFTVCPQQELVQLFPVISPASGLGLGLLADGSVQQLVPHYCHHSIHKLRIKMKKRPVSPASMQNM